jgi:hypothetical protein
VNKNGHQLKLGKVDKSMAGEKAFKGRQPFETLCLSYRISLKKSSI